MSSQRNSEGKQNQVEIPPKRKESSQKEQVSTHSKEVSSPLIKNWWGFLSPNEPSDPNLNHDSPSIEENRNETLPTVDNNADPCFNPTLYPGSTLVQ